CDKCQQCIKIKRDGFEHGDKRLIDLLCCQKAHDKSTPAVQRKNDTSRCRSGVSDISQFFTSDAKSVKQGTEDRSDSEDRDAGFDKNNHADQPCIKLNRFPTFFFVFKTCRYPADKSFHSA